jgi:hypothetical protein
MAPRDSRILVVGGDVIQRAVLPYPGSVVDDKPPGRLATGAQIGVLTLTVPGNSALAGLQQVLPIGGPYSERRSIVLLGDVIYSRDAMGKILHSDQEMVFVGTPNLAADAGEIFAVAWGPAQAARVKHMIDQSCFEAPRFSAYQPGQLRRILWKAIGYVPEPKHFGSYLIAEKCFLPIDDWTMDIDTPADLGKIDQIDRYAMVEERDREKTIW